MSQQHQQFSDEKPTVFKVFMGLNYDRPVIVHSEKEVWDVIGRHPFGMLYEVQDEDGNVMPEFIPF